MILTTEVVSAIDIPTHFFLRSRAGSTATIRIVAVCAVPLTAGANKGQKNNLFIVRGMNLTLIYDRCMAMHYVAWVELT